MSNISKFIKFSQYTHGVICEAYLLGQEPNKEKVTKKKICAVYKISRPWFDKILLRYKISRINGVELKAKSRINKRFETEDYKQKRRQKLIDSELKKATRKAKRELIKASRYEHKLSNSMWHMDLKLLPPILGEKIIKGQKQYLLNFVDDCTRKAYFEIIDGKNQHQVTAALKKIFARLPCTNIYSILSDNGKEFKGIKHQHAVEELLVEMGIKHYYTRVRRPQTNGKSERLNRTVNEEFLTQVQFNSRIERQLQLRYYEYHYNNLRPHQGINNQTPNQKYQALSLLRF